MEKKYELTNERTHVFGKDLWRIRALRTIDRVCYEGDLGGYVESENNLSHEGDCWIADNGRVYDDACISGNARVKDDACVREKARVYGEAWIRGSAYIMGSSRVYGDAEVTGDANVLGHARVYGSARVWEHSCIDEYARVAGNVYIFDHALIKGRSYVGGNAHIHDSVIIKDTARVLGTVWLYDHVRVVDNAIVQGDAVIYGEAVLGSNAKIHSVNDYMTVSPLGKQFYDTAVTFYRTDSKTERGTGVHSIWGVDYNEQTMTMQEYYAWVAKERDDIREYYTKIAELAELKFSINSPRFWQVNSDS